jgi:hypothetical protein
MDRYWGFGPDQLARYACSGS